MNVDGALRTWAKGVLPTEAAVELLIRAGGGRWADTGNSWIKDDAEDPAWFWVDFDAITADPTFDVLSGGEQSVLMIAVALGSERELYLTSAVTRLDSRHLRLVLTAIAHAAGMSPLHPWPAGPTRSTYRR